MRISPNLSYLQDVHDDPQGPHITGLVILLRAKHFRRCEQEGSEPISIRGVDDHTPTCQWRVEMTAGVFSSHVHRPDWHVHISPKYSHAGRTLHIQIRHKKTLIVCYFHLLFASMFKSRSTASLSRLEISVHTRANSFHITLLLQSASRKKKCREKRKANPVYGKEKTNRKWQDSWTSAASDEEHLWLTIDEAGAASVIIVRHWMNNLQAGRN